MKKNLFVAVVAMLLCCTPTYAQFWRQLGNAAENAAKNAAIHQTERVTERAIDRAVEGAEDAAVDATTDAINNRRDENRQNRENRSRNNRNNDDEVEHQSSAAEGWTCPACGTEGNTGKFCNECGAKKPEPQSAAASGWTCPSCGTEGNTGKFCNECGAKRPEAGGGNAAGAGGSAATTPQKQAEMAYAKCDFVAGDEIIFEDDLAGEQLGEFPSKWDLLKGSGEVAKLNGDLCINFPPKTTEHAGNESDIEPLMKNAPRYLPDVFTLEFDWYLFPYQKGEERLTDVNNELYLYFYNDFGGENSKPVEEVIELTLSQNSDFDHGTYYLKVQPSGNNNRYEKRNSEGSYTIKLNDWNHYAISFNKRALKIYVNGTRIVNIPNCWAPQRFKFQTSNRYIGNGRHNLNGTYIKNIRLAKGAVPLYDRMMTDGKFITYGITFDIGKSTIKPESMGEINRIVKLMQDNPDLKFEVQGHTDNTGNASSNQTLSEQRAKAIVAKLVEMGIAADRLTAVGKGQTSPLADNSTDEGRAKNRRVEITIMDK